MVTRTVVIRRLASAPALVLAVLLASASAAATVPRMPVRPAGGPVNALAMDGGRVAYDIGSSRNSNGAGNKVLVWNVLTGKTTRVSGRFTSGADVTSTGRGVRELAIAGERVAWIVNQGGNTESDDTLYGSSIGQPNEKKLASARRLGEVGSGAMRGNWIGGLVGSGARIAANRWTTDATGRTTTTELDLVGTQSLTRIVSGTTTTPFAHAVDGDRIAGVRPDGTVAVYSTSGKELLTVTPPSALDVALDGNYLLVLTKTRTLELYDARTGVHRKTLLLAGGRATPQNLDLQATLAVYTLGRELRVLNLATRRDSVLAKMSHGIEFAQLEAPGVVYAGNVPNAGAGAGTLVFVPFARVAAAVS